jgi:hypothetical protein
MNRVQQDTPVRDQNANRLKTQVASETGKIFRMPANPNTERKHNPKY